MSTTFLPAFGGRGNEDGERIEEQKTLAAPFAFGPLGLSDKAHDADHESRLRSWYANNVKPKS